MMDWFRGLQLKGVLAFYLVTLAFILVLLWMLHPPSGDANAIGLLAGFVTLIIKAAVDATGYQFNSSAGSDRKTDALVANQLPSPEPKP